MNYTHYDYLDIAPGADSTRIEKAYLALIEKLQPTNIEMVGRLPLAQIPLEIASATLCLGVFGTTDKARRVVPNKVFECVAVGRPVVTGDTPAIRRTKTGSA